MFSLTALLEWFAGWVLKYLADLATKEVKAKLADMAEDKARGVTNEANVKAYEDAIGREARRKAALDLLDRNTP